MVRRSFPWARLARTCTLKHRRNGDEVAERTRSASFYPARLRRAVDQAPAPADRALEATEEQGVDDDPDDQDDDHGCHQGLGVVVLLREVQPYTERRLLGDDHQQLAGHEAAPRE